MAQIGLRDEGRREWNFTLRGMSDRELLAAAQMACKAQDWQLCINTSERTREQIDLRQRYPMPFAAEITARAKDRGLDPAFVFGLIRQETRFMATLRSSAGAAGLMQLMPATARWTARKLGLPFQPEQVTDIDTNLRLGTTYLKLVLDDFCGVAAAGGCGLQRRPQPAEALARRACAGHRRLGREHPFQRNARLRQEGAGQCHHLQPPAGWHRAAAEGPAGPEHRPARRRHASTGRQPAMTLKTNA